MNCLLCEREKSLTEHHLIPKQMHKRLKKKYSKDELNKTISICRDCHSQIHKLFSEKLLALKYNTLELLKIAPGLEKFITWVRKQKGKVNMKGPKHRNGK